MFFYEYWLEEIKKDIFAKYKVSNPVFTLKGEVVDYGELRKWIFDIIHPSYNWLYYKKISDNKFEMSFFAPEVNLDVGRSIIKKFLDSLPSGDSIFTLSYTSTYFGHSQDDYPSSYIETIIGESLYDKEEIEGEIFYLVKNGKSKIEFFKDPTEEDGKTIYHLFVHEDTLPNMLKSGYLQLEYFD